MGTLGASRYALESDWPNQQHWLEATITSRHHRANELEWDLGLSPEDRDAMRRRQGHKALYKVHTAAGRVRWPSGLWQLSAGPRVADTYTRCVNHGHGRSGGILALGYFRPADAARVQRIVQNLIPW
ncbi:hypothetical protein J6590_012004 [Homalodisca vitripennis]|nr:hypothetical protein J6590_012004 [Homalodisca vitripennis]